MKAPIARPIAVFLLLACLSSPAYAYLDPATGSIIVQSVIAAVASWVMYTKMFAARARAFFRRFGKERDRPDAE
jgi:hypothetical protein